jgi:formyl-CoA transferase
MGVSFLAQNAGKRSITLNLKSEKGRALFKKLILRADVVVENFRPGVMDRLGLGFEALKALKPDLIYCAISGFGQDGPMRDLPAYDHIIQGLSGVMSITGAPDTAPYRVGYPISDTIGGLTAAMAVCAALANRGQKGGVMIDISMLEATLATMGWIVSNFLVAGVDPKPLGNENFTSAPSGTFETKDGPLNIAANKQEQFESLCKVIGSEELIGNPDFITRDLRKQNRYALKELIENQLKKRNSSEWAHELNRAGVPSGTVQGVADILAHPQIAGRGMIGEFKDVPGVGRDVALSRTAVKMDGAALTVDAPPPMLGADNEDIYGRLGLGPEDLAALKQEGVL